MTKEEAKELLPIIQAYAKGKPIQVLGLGGQWADVYSDLDFSNKPSYYRVKPEQRIRPYRHAEEFLKAQKEHGMYIMRPGQNDEIYYDLPTSVCDKCITLEEETGIFCSFSYIEISHMIWQDGTPCGITEEE